MDFFSFNSILKRKNYTPIEFQFFAYFFGQMKYQCLDGIFWVGIFFPRSVNEWLSQNIFVIFELKIRQCVVKISENKLNENQGYCFVREFPRIPQNFRVQLVAIWSFLITLNSIFILQYSLELPTEKVVLNSKSHPGKRSFASIICDIFSDNFHTEIWEFLPLQKVVRQMKIQLCLNWLESTVLSAQLC